MKKFLTVLLVIAVMFTFSFGSAFAAAPSSDANKFTLAQVETKIATNVAAAKTANNELVTRIINEMFGTAATKTVGSGSDAIVLDKEVVKAYLDGVVAEANAALDLEAAQNVNAARQDAAKDGFLAFTDETEDNTLGYYDFDATFATKTAADLGWTAPSTFALSATEAAKLAKSQLEAAKADEIEGIQKIDLSVYATELEEGAFKSNYELAKAIVDQAIAEISAVKAATADWAGYAAAIRTVDAYYTAAVGAGVPSGIVYQGAATGSAIELNKGLNSIEKIAATTVNAAKAEYAKTAVMKAMKDSLASRKAAFVEPLQAYNFAIALKSAPTKAELKQVELNKEAIAKAEADFAKAEEVIVYLVNATTKLAELGTVDANGSVNYAGYWCHAHLNTPAYMDDSFGITYTLDGQVHQYDVIMFAELIDRANDVAEFKDAAELAKASIALDGTVNYDVDGTLAKAIDKEYKTGNATFNPGSYGVLVAATKSALIGTCATAPTVNSVKVEKKAYPVVNEWLGKAKNTTESSIFDKAKIDEVKAVMAETKAAIRAAKTVEEAEAAFLAGYAKLDAIPTAADHAADFGATGSLYAKYQKYCVEFAAYAEAKANLISKLGDTTDYPTDFATKVKTYYVGTNNSGVFYTECFTEAELDAMFAEAKAFVDGVKTTKALDAEKTELLKEIAALPAVATVADKAAVEAVAAKVKAYNDYSEIVKGTNIYNITAPVQVSQIQTAESKAIEDAYDAIMKDGKVTLAEKEAVEALRTAFDEYCAYYQAKNVYPDLDRTVPAYEVTDAQIEALEYDIDELEADVVAAMIAKLAVKDVDAEAVRAARAAYDALSAYGKTQVAPEFYDKLVALEKVLADDVEALKITANSSAKKGSITVKWTVEGNTDAVEAYEIWKSTKKNSGFKKAFTTEKMSYKNTKGLKKGTRYYYKVRAIATIDGEKITSDWSNKAYRIAK